MKKRKRKPRGKSKKRWIGKAIKKHGALRATVKRKFGRRGFDSRGRIKVKVLRALAKQKSKTGRRAKLALTLRKLRS